MCGRLGLWLEEGFGERFNLSNEMEIKPNYNIAPGTSTAVVTKNSPNKGEYMRWGLIPPWAKDIRIGFKMINARAETILEKPIYKKCFKNQRCLVPFNAFYEWKKKDKIKVPYLFQDREVKYLSFAGLYEIAHDAEKNEIKSFTIITTKANNMMKGVHERMPVIFDDIKQEEAWLSKDTSEENLIQLLDGYTKPGFELFEIGSDVNKAENNYPDIIKRI